MSDGRNVVPIRHTGGINPIIPQSLDEVYRLAKAVQQSGLAPSTLRTPEAITVAIMTGLEIGLPPMAALNSIAVINGRPTIFGGAIPALLQSKGFRLHETVSDDLATCTVTRPDGHETTRTFSKADAITAGLWGKSGPWKQYPNRMLAARARAFAARDGAADALAGLYTSEEMQDVVDITPQRKSSAQGKRDGTTDVFDSIRAEIAAAETMETLGNVREKYAAHWETLPRAWAKMVHDDYDCRLADLTLNDTSDAADLIGNAINMEMLAHIRESYPDADWDKLEQVYDAKAAELEAVRG